MRAPRRRAGLLPPARAREGRAGQRRRRERELLRVDDRADAKTSPVAWAIPKPGSTARAGQEEVRGGRRRQDPRRNPFKEADALVTVERAGVLSSRVVTLKGPMPVVEVPVEADYFPNAFVAVHLVRGRVERAARVGRGRRRAGVPPRRREPRREPGDAPAQGGGDAGKKEYRPGEDVDADVGGHGPRRASPRARRADVLRGRRGRPDADVVHDARSAAGVRDAAAAGGVRRGEPRGAGAHRAHEERRARAAARLGVPGQPQRRRQGRRGRRRRGRDARGLQDDRVLRRRAGHVERRPRALPLQAPRQPDDVPPHGRRRRRRRSLRLGRRDDHDEPQADGAARRCRAIMRAGDTFEAGVIVSSRDLPATAADVSITREGPRPRGSGDAARRRAEGRQRRGALPGACHGAAARRRSSWPSPAPARRTRCCAKRTVVLPVVAGGRLELRRHDRRGRASRSATSRT